MSQDKLRSLMAPYGEVGRIHFAAENSKVKAKRQLFRGGSREAYSEGWVEFMDRRIAKRVAQTFHCTTVGGKKRKNRFRDDMWSMKYLPRFQWHMLHAENHYNSQVRKSKLDQ